MFLLFLLVLKQLIQVFVRGLIEDGLGRADGTVPADGWKGCAFDRVLKVVMGKVEQLLLPAKACLIPR